MNTATLVFSELALGAIFLTAGDIVFKSEIRTLSWGWWSLGLALAFGAIFLLHP